jgi:hypothetical protein
MALPAIPLGLKLAASIGIPIGQRIFAGRDQDKYDKKYGKQQAYNNFIAALSRGRIQPENTVQPRRGTGSKVMSALGTGLSAYNLYKQLGQEDDLVALQKREAEQALRLGDAELGEIAQSQAARIGAQKFGEGVRQDVQAGQDFASRVRPRQLQGPDLAAEVRRPGVAPPRRPALGFMQPDFKPSFGGDLDVGTRPSMSVLSKMARTPMGGGEQSGFGAASIAAATNARTLAEEERRVAKEDRQVAKEERDAAAEDRAIFQQNFNNRISLATLANETGERVVSEITGIASNYAVKHPEITFNEFASGETLDGLGPMALRNLEADYERTQRVAIAGKDEAYRALEKDLQTKLNANLLVKRGQELQFGINLLYSAYAQQNGAGDVFFTNSIIKLSDPGLGVRPAEAQTIVETQGILERMGLWTSGMKMEGNQFTPKTREILLAAGQDLYDRQQKSLGLAVDSEFEAAQLRPIIKSRGNARLKTYLNTYRIPALSTFKIPALRVNKTGNAELDSATASLFQRTADRRNSLLGGG